MTTTAYPHNHDLLIVEGGSMARMTDKRGNITRVCQICSWRPGMVAPRDRGGNDILTAAAHAPNPTTGTPVDPMSDMDADPAPSRNPAPLIAAAVATQRPWADCHGKAHVSLSADGYTVPPGGWPTVADAMTACKDLVGFDFWLVVYLPNGKVGQQISL